MTPWKRLDHVAIVVGDTDRAIEDFSTAFGATVVDQEELDDPPVRLTYLDVGAVTLQLVQPRPGNTELAEHLAAHGEGLHHVCFEVDDLLDAVRDLTGGREPELVIDGRGRRSAFLPGAPAHGLRIELTQLRMPGSPGGVA
jgi:methylmalonyl-CoA epimerase